MLDEYDNRVNRIKNGEYTTLEDLYSVKDKEVLVVDIIHSKRNPQFLQKKLK